MQVTCRFVKVTICCAQCGFERKQGNHWFVLRLPSGEDTYIYRVRRLDPASPPMSDLEYPACGESCLQKLESRILANKPSGTTKIEIEGDSASGNAIDPVVLSGVAR
jgi:hypothetical protein